MSTNNTLAVLTESIDEGICRMWYFHVAATEELAAKYQMAEQIIANMATYEEMFRGITWLSGLAGWYSRGTHTPETLLMAIDGSHIDGDSESRFEIHLVDLGQPHGRGSAATWTREEALAAYVSQRS